MPLNRSFTVSREAARGLAERILSGTPPSAPAPTTPAPAHQGRGSANLRLADQILARERHARTVIVPDLEPVDPDQGDVPWLDPELELPDPSFQQQLDEEDEEEPPRDEDGRFARQDEEEEPPPDDEEMALAAAQRDTTVIIVDEDNELAGEEDEPADQVPQVPA